jgi:hypothetical protein
MSFWPIVDAPLGLHRMYCGLPQTLLVAEPSFGGLPASDPDRLIKWFIGVVVMGVGVNLLTGLAVTREWAWLPPAVFVAALLVAVSNSGLLRAVRYGTALAHRMALLALTGYLLIVVWGSMTGWPFAVMILSVAYLWETGVMVMWSTLRSRADLDHVAVGTVCCWWVRRSCCWGSCTRWIHRHWAWSGVCLGSRSCCSEPARCCSGSRRCVSSALCALPYLPLA